MRRVRKYKQLAYPPAAATVLFTLAGCQTPLSTLDPASDQAEHIARVWYWMAWGSMAIVMLMVLLTTLAIRARPQGQAPRRNLGLLLGGGILFPLTVIVALIVYAYGAAPASSEARIHIEVSAHRWWWDVSYSSPTGEDHYSVNEIHIPAGTPVQITLTASDVIHSFWVPRLGGKMDAIPGRRNRLTLEARQPGVYEGTCAEYCGVGHASMKFRVVAHDPEQWPKTVAALSKTRRAP